jgi:nucleoside-diphosphate-sugar epimerase
MDILITGAAGNLGSHLARHLLDTPHRLRLLIHRQAPPEDIAKAPGTTVFRADLADPDSLAEPCRGTDCIVHFAGVLFKSRPRRFLPHTNIGFVQNLCNAAHAAGVGRFIIISFPHVEGESTPHKPAMGMMEGHPDSVHARTRLAAEKLLFNSCRDSSMTAISLRSGMVYGRDILMIDAARWLSRRHLLAVWKKPTWIHLLSLPDFLDCVQAAIEKEDAAGVYNLGDDHPLTLQDFLDRVTQHWGNRRPWRAPKWSFYAGAWGVELFATVFRTRSPITRDFIRIGMASYTSDTTRMKRELLPVLEYPTLDQGIRLLRPWPSEPMAMMEADRAG